MFCYVILPNSVVHEVELDSKATGSELLEKICSMLGIIEEDYFGLMYKSSRSGDMYWLNNRNLISRQLPQPYRLCFRVKFYVEPHLVLQETARHQFYLNIKNDILEDRLRPTDDNELARLTALIAQAESGDYKNGDSQHYLYSSYFSQTPPGFVQMVAVQHQHLTGMDQASAEYRMIQACSTIANFGIDFYQAQGVLLGVGQDGIAVQKKTDGSLTRIPYTSILTATQDGKLVAIVQVDDDGNNKTFEFRLRSGKMAAELYRAITEKHAFYRCETVRNDVVSQYSRDLKGTLVSLFNEKTPLGKNYVFDVRRTCREVHDYARRLLHSAGAEAPTRNHDDDAVVVVVDDDHHMSFDHGEHCHNTRSGDGCCMDTRCQVMKEKLDLLHDAMLCRICMDEHITIVFIPCGHAVCCKACAKHESCKTCPLCRTEIDCTQQIFLPIAHGLAAL